MNIDKQNFNKQLGHNIAVYRQRSGLTQEQLAEKVELGNEAISRIERGVAMPSLLRLFEFARVFNCKISDLLDQKIERDEAEYIALLLQHLSISDKKFVMLTLQNLVEHLQSKY